MIKRILLLALVFQVSILKADPPPPVQVICEQVIAGLRQQLESTNIVLTSNVDKTLKLRISKNYEIFDSKGKLVKKGSGKEIDVSDLASGRYTIKFDKDSNQIEYFTRN
ncbi:MAG TPA: hypothetical protein DEP18_08795 [Flavobacteriales bacterium]|nr:hypothetical protein [Flavobacteriales bacterium]HCA83874.1 hypothetical protein [Flavobacteriales bacterium]HRE76036.1 T9SS type A sorting domain-containing protein [Flavobacteriales bacterium]HRE98335.1 T9SS type A sorting domain-containing protein [Flavobacteriales bacterium]HRJ35143.1 T9SS type A sorting domain-containing protein [Flavobacteriales bacterium]